jgi:dTDP-4-amino-4,6-dideoxygalactose transaminase
MIRLIKPYISFDEVRDMFHQILDSGILTKGPYSIEWPRRLCEYTGAKYAFNTTSATTALAACLEALGIGSGDEVVVSDFSFPASANIVEACGARPVFADVSPDTYNVLPDELESKITRKTRAVMFIDALGNPDGIHSIMRLCRERGIPLIEDAACSLGSSEDGQKTGAIADLTCFSFHPRKLLTAGEGGAILTNNDEYAKKLTIKLAHGSTGIDGTLNFVTYGYNYRLPELQCAMLIKQLEKLDDIVTSRVDAYNRYHELIGKRGYLAQAHSKNVVHNRQSVVFSVPGSVDRDGLIEHLKINGVESTIGTYCQSVSTYFRKKYNDVQKNAEWLWKHTVTLPCYDGVDTELIAKKILEYM